MDMKNTSHDEISWRIWNCRDAALFVTGLQNGDVYACNMRSRCRPSKFHYTQGKGFSQLSRMA